MIKGHALVDLNPEKEIFQLGFEVFQIFIIQDDQKVLNKILYDIDDRLQRIQRGMYQNYYYENLFNSLENIIIINRKQV